MNKTAGVCCLECEEQMPKDESRENATDYFPSRGGFTVYVVGIRSCKYDLYPYPLQYDIVEAICCLQALWQDGMISIDSIEGNFIIVKHLNNCILK